jgi:hypothetical protein
MTTDEMSMPVEQGYPVRVDIDYPDQLSRLLIFVKWLLAIPHYLVLFLYAIGAWFAAIAAFFTILFAGNIPVGLYDFILGYNRWTLRVNAYTFLLTDKYPPFTNAQADFPARIECERAEQQSRLLIFVKWLLVIPHWIVIIFYAIAVLLVTIYAWFAILFTGKYPSGVFEFVVGFFRWTTRVEIYSGTFAAYNPYVGGLLRDEYPPFSNKQ